MAEAVQLVKPSSKHKDQYLEFYKDWIKSGEDIVPWVVERDPSDFTEYLDFLYLEDSEEKLINPNFVPHSTYWLINDAEEIVGAVNIRHRLNQKLLNCGGHIGYGIAPSHRRKGYAHVLLVEALKVTYALGIDKVLLVCDKGNVASEKTILRNGGVFESEFREDDGNTVKRFWIHPEGDLYKSW